MKYSIRKGCWESNSSSVHTITISKAGLEKNRMRLYDGMIHIHCRAYDKEPEILETQKEKLTYIVSWVVYKHGGYGWKTLDEDRERMYEIGYIEDALHEYDESILGIVIHDADKAYIDHQSSDDCEVNLYSNVSIRNFVFNKYIALSIYSD